MQVCGRQTYARIESKCWELCTNNRPLPSDRGLSTRITVRTQGMLGPSGYRVNTPCSANKRRAPDFRPDPHLGVLWPHWHEATPVL